jgi:hypothetical protein
MVWSNPEFPKDERDALRAKFPFPWSEEVQRQRSQEFFRNLKISN